MQAAVEVKKLLS